MWKKNSLRENIQRYFLLFSAITIGLLWIFQFVLFKYFYKEQKMNDIKATASKIKKYQNNERLETILNNLALDKRICIEVDNNDLEVLYSSTYYGKECMNNTQETYLYKFDFISNNKQEKIYQLTHPTLNKETIVYAIQLKNNQYVFINTSIEPIDDTQNLIKKQLIVITLLGLLLSYTAAYFISNHLSKPIKQMSKEAQKLAKGNFDIHFQKDTNIEEIDELSDTLNYAKEELEKTEELRRDLMANISHDLKTPLTMIKGYAEIAKDLHLDNKEKQIEDMDTIISETDRLTILVNDILEISRMESIKDELNKTEFDLIQMINEILLKYKVLQETEKYKFKFIHKEKEIKIVADQKRLEQVIYNLINNAINYTGEDNLVTIKVIKEENIRVEIKDTGKGIKEEDIPYIWDKYYKNKKKHKRNLIGTGLGLSIVKKILEQHHYPYGVESTLNKGTTFYFEITKEP